MHTDAYDAAKAASLRVAHETGHPAGMTYRQGSACGSEDVEHALLMLDLALADATGSRSAVEGKVRDSVGLWSGPGAEPSPAATPRR